MITETTARVRHLYTRPLQPLLIVTAMALGVSVITAVTAYVQSSRQNLEVTKQALEFRQIIVFGEGGDVEASRKQTEPLPRKVERSSPPTVFSPTDLDRIRDAAPSVDYAYVAPPAFRTQFFTLMNGSEAGVATVNRDYMEAAKLKVTDGEGFSKKDFHNQNPVMLVTASGAGRLGLTGNPVGQTFGMLAGGKFTVIGVLPDPDEALAEYDALIPEGTSSSAEDSLLPTTSLVFAVDDADEIDNAQAEIEAFVRRTWGDDVAVYAQSLAEITRTAQLSEWVTAIFAALGLIIAALNIMNLFVAQVFRQQRELAIRRSLGATRGDILGLVLGEVLLLGMFGGLLGVAAGAGLTLAIDAYIQSVTANSWPSLTLSVSGVALGLAFAIGLSILFGLYPALSASRLNFSDVLGEN